MKEIDNNLKRIIELNLDGKFESTPIGHHNLGRHYVYLLKDKNKNEYILKIYGRENRWCREIISLDIVHGSIPCPKIIAKGRLKNGTEWLLMSKIEGIILEKVWDSLCHNNKREILEHLGEMLSDIHNNYNYEYFGTWKEFRVNSKVHTNFLDYRKEKDKEIYKNIMIQDLPDKDLLLKAYNKMKKYYDLMSSSKNICICHHDFSARNTMVIKKNERWQISGIIDFEHCYPNDAAIDFTDLYQTLFLEQPQYEYSFLKGYTKNRVLPKTFDKKIRYYLYNKGLFICSWAYSFTYEYYREGIKLLKWLLDYK